MKARILCIASLLASGIAAAQPPPSEDLPPAGRSLFDFLVTTEENGRKVQRVPFPFQALLSRVREQVEGGAGSALRVVLIPMGRSLQRNAAADETFRYPRVVAAAVGESTAPGAGMQLKDRLYLGYHEKAGVLEVISYNEAAGRFEFQVVRDYRENGKPRVLYASRRMCLACHQNAGPIFSRPPWNETNANPDLRKLLHEQNRDFYGVAVDLGADAPNSIDRSASRANRFAMVQRLWSEGCEAPSRPQEAAVRCRAEAFAAALKYRLSGDRRLDSRAPGYGENFVPVLTESWRRRWPEGIAVPSPEIPNRDPLETPAIAPDIDPLAPREPIDLRLGARREDIEHFVKNLAEFIAEADLLALDRRMGEKFRSSQGEPKALRVPCRLSEHALAGRASKVQFACMAPAAVLPDVAVSGWLERRGTHVLRGAFDRFAPERRVTGDIDVLPAAIVTTAGGAEVELTPSAPALSLRPVDGNAVAALTLRWSRSTGRNSTGHAELRLLEDFAPVAKAIAEIAEETLRGRSDLFSARPFRRAGVMKALFGKLGMPARNWCCLEEEGMPAPQAESGRGESASAGLAPFYSACAACHAAQERFPPGFLHGGPATAARNIDACAERMLYRIQMWDLPPGKRAKSPMPPAIAGEVDFAAMKKYLRTRVTASLAGPYEVLRRCAPVF